eukprot:351281-Chlamydomonas_euryale.AAC.4
MHMGIAGMANGCSQVVNWASIAHSSHERAGSPSAKRSGRAFHLCMHPRRLCVTPLLLLLLLLHSFHLPRRLVDACSWLDVHRDLGWVGRSFYALLRALDGRCTGAPAAAKFLGGTSCPSAPWTLGNPWNTSLVDRWSGGWGGGPGTDLQPRPSRAADQPSSPRAAAARGHGARARQWERRRELRRVRLPVGGAQGDDLARLRRAHGPSHVVRRCDAAFVKLPQPKPGSAHLSRARKRALPSTAPRSRPRDSNSCARALRRACARLRRDMTTYLAPPVAAGPAAAATTAPLALQPAANWVRRAWRHSGGRLLDPFRAGRAAARRTPRNPAGRSVGHSHVSRRARRTRRQRQLRRGHGRRRCAALQRVSVQRVGLLPRLVGAR